LFVDGLFGGDGVGWWHAGASALGGGLEVVGGVGWDDGGVGAEPDEGGGVDAVLICCVDETADWKSAADGVGGEAAQGFHVREEVAGLHGCDDAEGWEAGDVVGVDELGVFDAEGGEVVCNR